ncbi:MAG: hypothetical protein UY95_C0004G0009 [Parcubacteria group bacterium GW2011_GWA2_56_7]|nr:MAG: hypothetical protein UY95_C0004G0009 [Parcubacteria group bacterium GW2011_GWA2_56_7]
MKGYYVATAIFVLAIVGWYVGSRGSDFVGDLPSDVVREAMPEGDQTRRVIPSEGTRVLFGDLGSGLYDFSAVLPVSWEVEVVSDIDALNIYDPELPGESTLEKSQLFLRTFEASQFAYGHGRSTFRSKSQRVYRDRPASRSVSGDR